MEQTKVLDKTAYNYAVKLVNEENFTQRDVAKLLAEEGYTTRTGAKVTQASLSVFMIKNGFRMRNVKKSKKPKTNAAYESPVQLALREQDEVLAAAKEILESNMSANLRKKLLKGLLEDSNG